MFINVEGHHVEITQPLRAYAEEKMRSVARHNPNVESIVMFLKVDKHVRKAESMYAGDKTHIAEATVHLRGKQIFADAAEADLYTCIDNLTAKLTSMVIKDNKKSQKHNRGKKSKFDARGL